MLLLEFRQQISVSACHACERSPISITISKIPFFFSMAFVNTCDARNDLAANLLSYNRPSLASDVPDVFTAISESRVALHRFGHTQVQNPFKNIPKLSRPLNSAIMVKGMNIPILVDWADAAPIGAAIAGAAARPLCSMMRLNLVNSSSVKLAVRSSVLPSIFP